jgi:hypothetical protein
MKTPLLKSNLLIKPSIVLAAAVLTAASFLAPSTGAAADLTYLMPTGRGGGQPDNGIQPFDPNPADLNSLTRQFMTYGKDSDNNPVTPKTLTITNDTHKTVYPFPTIPRMTPTTTPTENIAVTSATSRAANTISA